MVSSTVMTYYSLFTIHYPLFTIHYLPFIPIHLLCLALDEVACAVDAAQLQNEIAYRSLHQHCEIASGRDGNGDFAHVDSHDLLPARFERQALDVVRLGASRFLEMHDQ